MTSINPDTLIRPEIRALSAYRVPPATGLIKLDAMENPHAWPGELQVAWQQRLDGVQLNRYPDPTGTALKARLRQVMAIPDSMDVLLGNGSDELIQLVAMAVAMPGRTVVAPEPSFVMYRMIATFVGMDYIGVPLNASDFSLDRAAMLEAIERHKPALVFLAYPNNPTGNLFDADAMQDIIQATPGLVVVDEAYFTFAGQSFIGKLAEYDNLLLMRTVSKQGLAGLRLGYLVGSEQWLNEIDKLRLPYNINVLTQLSVEFALEHHAVLDAQAQSICAERERLLAELQQWSGITAYPSATNFILLRTPEGQAERLFAALLEAGVLIKNLHPVGGLLQDCLRVTVGAPEENRAMLGALQDAL